MNENMKQFEDELFIPQKKESAVDVVINNIKNLLITKRLNPGDRIPAENDLCRTLSVSRGSVREAMKILSALGIVEVKRGDGTYIAQSANKVMFDPLLFSLILSDADIKELVELRELMELAIIDLVIKNAEEKDIECLKSAYRNMEIVLQEHGNEVERLSQSDIEFHKALVLASNNKLLEKIYGLVLDFFYPTIHKTYGGDKNGVNALKVHKDILDSILEKDSYKATKAIKNSVLEWVRLFSS